VSRYTGQSKDFSDVQRALEALEHRYRRAGYSAVQVVLPEQELEQGVIVFEVIEPRLGKVTVQGNKFFDEANIRRSLPALKEGEAPNVTRIGQNSRLANENAAKRTTVLLRSGAKEGEVDATVRVQDEKFWRASVSLDNTGSPSTGMYRVGLGYQHSNLFNLDHTLTFQYQLDPEPLHKIDNYKVFGLGYRIPLYGQNASLDLLAGYSDIGSASGQVIEGVAFNVSGSGTIFGARYNYMLPRITGLEDYDHRIAIGLDYKAFSNQVAEVSAGVVGENLTPEITVHPLSVTYAGSRRTDNSEVSFFGSIVHNIYPHGPDAYREKFYGPPGIGVRPGVGRPTYTLYRYGFNFIRGLANDVQLRANITGQWTRDALAPGEQFGLGGWENLRGMHERESANDRGYRGSFEIYSPDLSSRLGLDGGRVRLLAFFDWGSLQQNFKHATVCGPATCGVSASSYGFGLRASIKEGFSVRFDYGRLLDPGAIGERNDDRVHFGLAVGF
jgi:hemolysin activation/secretion protein